MAQFVNESTKMGFKMTIDEKTKTVSLTKIANAATANKLNNVASKIDLLFAATPHTHNRTSVDLIEAE